MLFCEHKFLQYLKAESLPDLATPAFKARLARRDGIVTAGRCSESHCAETVEDGYEIEVVDLRTVKPWTPIRFWRLWAYHGRMLCSAGWRGGVAAEVVARVTAEGLGLLDAPPQRLNARDTPVPYHPDLWTAHRPTASAIASAMQRLLEM